MSFVFDFYLVVLNYKIFNILAFSQICVTAIGNLMQKNIKNENSQVYFSVNKDIMPFVNLNWGIITTVTKKANRIRYVGVCINYVMNRKRYISHSKYKIYLFNIYLQFIVINFLVSSVYFYFVVQITRALKRGTDTLFGVQINTTNSKLYKLLLDVSEIKPNYESMFKNGQLIVTEFGVQIGTSKF